MKESLYNMHRPNAQEKFLGQNLFNGKVVLGTENVKISSIYYSSLDIN